MSFSPGYPSTLPWSACRVLLLHNAANDDALSDTALATAAAGFGHTIEVTRSRSLREAEASLALGDIDVIVFDAVEPAREIDEAQALRRVASGTPIVLLTDADEHDKDESSASWPGIVDRLRRPYVAATDVARAICFAHLRQARADTALVRNAIRGQHTDELTGVRNRRYLDDIARAGEWSDWGCVLIALEGLQPMHDVTGYRRSREIVRGVADFLCGHVREGDVVIRTGDEEFLLLLPDAAAASTPALAERLRHAAVYAPCAFSLGVAVRGGDETLQQTLDRTATQLRSTCNRPALLAT